MVDTTCEGARTLHFARTNYKVNFDGVKIASETEPVLAYQAPGALGEEGGGRQYSFLMYTQPGNDELSDLQIPAEGQPFDVAQFQSDNGFRDPAAGLGMLVDLGGQSNCGGGGGGGGGGQEEEEPEPSSPPAEEQPEETEAPSTPSDTADATPSPTPEPEPPSEVTPEPTEAPETPSSAPSETPEAPESTPEETPSAPAQTSAPAAEPSETVDEIVPSTSAPEAQPTEEPVGTIISTIIDNGTPSTLLTSASDAPGSETTTGGPVLQTTSDAGTLKAGFAVMVSAMVFAGLLAW
jgi:hypothetical protein